MFVPAPSSPWLRGLVVLILVGVLYGAGVAGNGFTFDDHPYLENNQQLRSLAGIGYLFFHPLEEGDTLRAHLYRPLAALVEASIGGAFGFTPHAFHGASLALYAGLGLLLFALLRRLFPPNLAWVAVLIFLVHPVHTEAVASAVGITELLAALFTVAALERLLPAEGRPGPARLAAAALLLLGGLLSKETVLLLPLLALLVMWRRAYSWREMTKILALLALPIAVYFAMRYQVIGSLLKAEQMRIAVLDNPLVNLPPLQRAANGAFLLLRSLLLLVFPWRLSADYSLAALPAVSLAWGAAAALLHLGLIAVAWLARQRAFAVTLGLAFFYLGLLPTANLFFVSGTIFGERFLLLPVLALALPVAHLLEEAKSRLFALALVALLLVGFAGRTLVRVGDWKNDLTLFSSALAAYPQNAKMNYDVALLLQRQGKNAEALPLAEKALAIYPEYGDARLLLARLLRGKNQDERAEALLREGLGQNPLHEEMWVELGQILIGRRGGTTKARDVFREGHEKLPASVKLAHNLAMVELELGQPEIAEPLLRQVLAKVDWPDAHYAMGFVLLGKKDYPAAIRHFDAALASPQWGGQARFNGALARELAGDHQGALDLLEKAEPGAENALLAAVALAKVGQQEEAQGMLQELGLSDPAQCPPATAPLGQLCLELLRGLPVH